jgi:hypothetical protein
MEDTIHDSIFIPYRYFRWEYQGRKRKNRHCSWTIMIRVAQHQCGGFFIRLAWDPEISILDDSTTDTEVRANFFFHDIGSLEE